LRTAPTTPNGAQVAFDAADGDEGSLRRNSQSSRAPPRLTAKDSSGLLSAKLDGGEGEGELVPAAGYVLQLWHTGGGSAKGLLFINVCSSRRLPAPNFLETGGGGGGGGGAGGGGGGGGGGGVDEDMSIPLAVGPARAPPRTPRAKEALRVRGRSRASRRSLPSSAGARHWAGDGAGDALVGQDERRVRGGRGRQPGGAPLASLLRPSLIPSAQPNLSVGAALRGR
jgi:hypothetical protein